MVHTGMLYGLHPQNHQNHVSQHTTLQQTATHLHPTMPACLTCCCHLLQGVTGGITLLLPQGCSPLLGIQALPLAADTPAGALCAGSLLRAIHGFYQATVEAPAALLEMVVGGAGGAGAAGGLSQLGSQVVAASGAASPQQSSKGGGVASGAGMMKVTRGALLGAGVCFAGLQRVQGSSHAAVYRLLLN